MENKRIASIAENENEDKVIKIVFPYDLTMLGAVRSILGRQYHKEQDCWSIPLFTDNIETLLSWKFSLDDKLDAYYKKSKLRMYEKAKIDIPGLKGTLYPFQNWGVSFTEEHNGRILNADEMGLGKTVSSLAYLQMHREKIPVIIVCPAIAKLMWERAIHDWLSNADVEILTGERPYKISSDFVIINYDIVSKWIVKLQELDASVIILDEVHYIKSDKAKRTKAIKRIAKGIPHILCLSGTPIENRPVEIYNAWKLVDPINCPEYWSFTKRYCKRKKNYFGGWDVNGADNVAELHKILTGTIMLRRKKVDVLKDLPAKVASFVPMYLHNKKDYEAAEADFIAYVKEVYGQAVADKKKKAIAITKMEELKQLAVKGKLPEVIEWIKDFLEIENKLVVFAWHTFVIDALMEAFPTGSVRVDGSTKNKQAAADKFQNDPDCHLFVGQMKAAGVAITLTAASNVGIIEYPWTPGTLNQAIDRVHRITQKGSVTVYYFMAQNTIEEKMAKVLDAKQKVIGAVIDGDENPADTTLFADLMRDYAEKANIIKRTKFN